MANGCVSLEDDSYKSWLKSPPKAPSLRQTVSVEERSQAMRSRASTRMPQCNACTGMDVGNPHQVTIPCLRSDTIH